MLTKTRVLEVINELPSVFSVEELIEKLQITSQTGDKNTSVDLKSNVSRSWEEIEQKIMTEGKVI